MRPLSSSRRRVQACIASLLTLAALALLRASAEAAEAACAPPAAHAADRIPQQRLDALMGRASPGARIVALHGSVPGVSPFLSCRACIDGPCFQLKLARDLATLDAPACAVEVATAR